MIFPYMLIQSFIIDNNRIYFYKNLLSKMIFYIKYEYS